MLACNLWVCSGLTKYPLWAQKSVAAAQVATSIIRSPRVSVWLEERKKDSCSVNVISTALPPLRQPYSYMGGVRRRVFVCTCRGWKRMLYDPLSPCPVSTPVFFFLSSFFTPALRLHRSFLVLSVPLSIHLFSLCCLQINGPCRVTAKAMWLNGTNCDWLKGLDQMRVLGRSRSFKTSSNLCYVKEAQTDRQVHHML